MSKSMKSNDVIILTGLSGAGISSILKAMEDIRYEVFDNFPLAFIPDLHAHTDLGHHKKGIAIGVDTRTRGFSPEAVLNTVDNIKATLVFITCDGAELHKRFTETRRRHPMAQDKTVSYGIKTEKELLEPLRRKADIVIDSTGKSVHDLRHMLDGYFAPDLDENLTISLVSFGFKNGVPREADIVMDVRFLKNPHWDKELKPKTGLDQEVGAYIKKDEGFDMFLHKFQDLIESLLPRYNHEGKSYLTIAIGCTGGKHRSVFTVETLKAWLEDKGLGVYAEHRDIPTL